MEDGDGLRKHADMENDMNSASKHIDKGNAGAMDA